MIARALDEGFTKLHQRVDVNLQIRGLNSRAL
jgi:hypothetical protein